MQATYFNPRSMIYGLLSVILWPVIFTASMIGSYFAFESDHPILWFNVVYLTSIAVIALFERLMPYERSWLEPDGETFNNVAHTTVTKGLTQIAAAITTSFPLLFATIAQPALHPSYSLWPSEAPMFVQAVLGLVIAEFGLYFAHRLSHERLTLWRFHALHHSVERLWVLNTGRFHFVESLFKMLLGQLPLYLLGAPLPVFLWLGAVSVFIGLLTHCNIDMRTGLLDRIFTTPRIHRWHHSRDLREGNTNYCENIVIWDQVFGTYLNPPRPSSTDIGISGTIDKSFLGQIVQPFSKAGMRRIMGKAPRESDRSVPKSQEQPERQEA
jgi:ornithine lipid hydroxylase